MSRKVPDTSMSGSPRTDNESSAETRRHAREFVNRGARLLSAGKATQAIPILERACKLDPEDVGAAINLGGAYVMAGKQRQAIPILEAARDREPENVMIWINLGAAYLDRPPYMTPEGEEKAIIAFGRALELDPRAVSVSYNLGLIYKDRGDFEQAIFHFEQAIQANSADRHARLWRDRLIAALQAHEEEGNAAQSDERLS
jgi:tetratricopeptide (TPR) repeat protein